MSEPSLTPKGRLAASAAAPANSSRPSWRLIRRRVAFFSTSGRR